MTGYDFERGRAREPFGGSRGKRVGTGGKIERDTTAYYFQHLTFHDCHCGVGGREGNFQFAGSGFQRGIRSSQRYGSTRNEVFLELPGLESLLAQFDGMVSGIDGGLKILLDWAEKGSVLVVASLAMSPCCEEFSILRVSQQQEFRLIMRILESGPEVGFEEIAIDLLQAGFWIAFCWPTIRE